MVIKVAEIKQGLQNDNQQAFTYAWHCAAVSLMTGKALLEVERCCEDDVTFDGRAGLFKLLHQVCLTDGSRCDD